MSATGAGSKEIGSKEVGSKDPIVERLSAASQAEQEGRIEDAAAILAGLGTAISNRPAGLHLAGIVAARRQNYAEAATHMEAALTQADTAGLVGPAKALIYRNLIEVYRRLSRTTDAVAAGKAALALVPDDTATMNNLGVAHYDAHDYDAAIACFDRAIALAADNAGPRFGRGEVLLSQGDYIAGWEGYAWRFRLPGVAAPVPPSLIERVGARAWDGEKFDGTLLLAADQGFGDVVNFARYIPWAAARCTRLLLAASRDLFPVAAQFPQVAEYAAEWEHFKEFDAWATLSDLPGLAGTRFETIPAEIPYLTADPARVARWSARLDELTPPGARRVGLAWAGRSSHTNDFARSVKLARLGAFGDVGRIAWISLQKGPGQEQVGDYFGHAPLINLGAEIEDYDDTMAVLACLDLLVSVDTSVVHVAGAMGRPVWLMLPHRADWRWGNHGETTPWYPSARLFRQPAPMAWEAVAAAVVEALG